jgi:5-methylcytosine-specific restriction protein A
VTKGRLGKLAPMVRTLDSSVAKPLSVSPSYGQGRGGRPWRRTREAILKRDRYLCQPCYREGRITKADEVDHITPQAEGGTGKDSNLESICIPCHKIKSQAEAARGIRSIHGK